MKSILVKLSSLAACTMGLVLATPASADAIPYPTAGIANPVTYTFTAANTGDVIAYFYGQSASYGSMIGLSINGAAPAVFGLQNHMSGYGASFNMGSVNMGDTLRFILDVSTSNGYGPPVSDYQLNSDASLNAGGENFVYSTGFSGDAWIPVGTYIGFEDIAPLSGGDRDYNDHQFVFTNVKTDTHTVPDATSTLALMGLATAGLLAVRRRVAA